MPGMKKTNDFVLLPPDQPPSQDLNTVIDCGDAMGSCTEVIGLWSVGIGGACLNENMGFLIGGETGFKYAMIEVTSYQDSS